MNILLNKRQLKQLTENVISQDELGEIAIKKKRLFGSGMYHKVYESNRYPDRVFKVGKEDSVREAYAYFMNYPYLFPKVYRYSKLGEHKSESGEDLYYLMLEKLDTNSFISFFKKLNEVSGDVIYRHIMPISVNFNENQEEWKKILDYLKTKDKTFYEKALGFFTLLRELNEIYDMPDVHIGQFGYDNAGVLKCLDF
jgi:hypothetical protein